MKLKITKISDNSTLGTIEMPANKFEELAAFDDHLNKPMNLLLTQKQVKNLKKENEDEDGNVDFLEDDEISLEVA